MINQTGRHIGQSNHITRVRRGHSVVAYNNGCERLGVSQQAQANIEATLVPIHWSRLLAEGERACLEPRSFRFIRD
jgi:hypothetical protein